MISFCQDNWSIALKWDGEHGLMGVRGSLYVRENGFAHAPDMLLWRGEGWWPLISAANCLYLNMTSFSRKEENSCRSSCVQVVMPLPSVCICHHNTRAPCSCHREIIDVYEYSRVEMGQMLKIMAQNNIFADESWTFSNERLLGVGEGVSQDELNCNQQLATFKGKKKPCPLSALGVAFPGAQMSVEASPHRACLGFPWFI